LSVFLEKIARKQEQIKEEKENHRGHKGKA
jgi:hypothetical protein